MTECAHAHTQAWETSVNNMCMYILIVMYMYLAVHVGIDSHAYTDQCTTHLYTHPVQTPSQMIPVSTRNGQRVIVDHRTILIDQLDVDPRPSLLFFITSIRRSSISISQCVWPVPRAGGGRTRRGLGVGLDLWVRVGWGRIVKWTKLLSLKVKAKWTQFVQLFRLHCFWQILSRFSLLDIDGIWFLNRYFRPLFILLKIPKINRK